MPSNVYLHPGRACVNRSRGETERLQEVFAARDAYAADHGYDLYRICADLKHREAGSRLLLVKGHPLARA